jgi:hypothetical protein
LDALLRRQLREDFLGRLLVYVGWEVRGHLLISGSLLLIGDRGTQPGCCLLQPYCNGAGTQRSNAFFKIAENARNK